MRIWCGISGHGMGHVGQVAPVLTALQQQLAEQGETLEAHIHCQVPYARLQRKLGKLNWQHHEGQTDIGLIQHHPMVPDLAATERALNDACGQWPQRVTQLAARIAVIKPDLILADIPPMTLAAAKQLAIPTVALSSLSWEAIYADYFSHSPYLQKWTNRLHQAYAEADLALLPEPAMGQRRFSRSQRIPAILDRGEQAAGTLRARLGIATTDRRPLVLLSLGGIQAQALPLEPLTQADHLHFLVDAPNLPEHAHIHGLAPLSHWPFADIMASVDGVVGKPGYNMAVEAVAWDIPFFYSPRGHFADEPPIEAWLAEYGRAKCYDWGSLMGGEWLNAWQALISAPIKPRPAFNGAEVAARMITSSCNRQSP
uniref:Uncharacterized protein n=1 Tax=Magnetococcus massalia (strain MO-1) TaxID=451514 RepID=A0A1S7LJQ8_MAGMO|nr:conserved protein of unknown function [Candidatus Magnetococcus massalia]